MDNIIKRNIWNNLVSDLERQEITVLLGPRQTGKTTLLIQLQEYLKNKKINSDRIYYYNFDDLDLRTSIKRDFRYLIKDIEAKSGISIKEIQNKIYLFLDEGQKAPEIFDLSKILYDSRINIKIIISGSSSLNIKKATAETLSGRVNYIYLFPLSYQEMAKTDNSIYPVIENIRNENPIKSLASRGMRMISEMERILNKALMYGSLPKIFSTVNPEDAVGQLNNFITSYLDSDIKDLEKQISLVNFNLSFKYLTEYTANQINYSKISEDTGIKRESLYKYFTLLEKTMVINTVPPYIFPELKSIFKAKKLYFFDTGIVNRLRGYMNFAEMERSGTAGNIFENFIFQNLLAHASNDVRKPSFYYFRDYQNHEIDLIYRRGNVTIPIESTSSVKIPNSKIRNFRKFFRLNPGSEYGLVFYPGMTGTIKVEKRVIYTIPYFLV